MDENTFEEKPGLFERVKLFLTREEEVGETDEESEVPTTARTVPAVHLKSNYRYTVTVRRHVTSFDDAMAAANGLKSGEQQLINLAGTDVATRQKIVDFMCGVNYAQEGTWEEVGEHIYLIVPPHAYVEVIPPSARGTSLKN